MAKNRRKPESMRFTIGRSCYLLFAGILCVGFSVTKIIVGSEYVSKCPSREMIPVYIIVSGCLPVLLSALRQPYDSGQEMEKDRWSMKLTLIIAVIGVMVNLAWLVAGTYLVVSIWSGNICSTSPTLVIPGTISMPGSVTTSTTNRTAQSEFKHNSDQIVTPDNRLNELIAEKYKSELYRSFNETDNITTNEDNGVSKIVVGPKPTIQMIQTTLDIIGTRSEPVANLRKDNHTKSTFNVAANDTINSKDVNDIDDETRSNAKFAYDIVIPNDSVLSSKTVNEEDHNGDNFIKTSFKTRAIVNENVDISETDSKDKPCITCDIHILRFSLAVIIIDWLFVTFGFVYFCNFVYRRFSSIKSEILLINA